MAISTRIPDRKILLKTAVERFVFGLTLRSLAKLYGVRHRVIVRRLKYAERLDGIEGEVIRKWKDDFPKAWPQRTRQRAG